MVKFFLKKSNPPSPANKKKSCEETDTKAYLFFVYIRWSQDGRELKTYMRTKKLKSEIDMICNGLHDLVSDPEMKLNNKNIKMAVLYQLQDDHDPSTAFDVTGILPTRLDHHLNSDPVKRIRFTQDQIDRVVNHANFVYRSV